MQSDGVTADRNSYFFTVSACSRRGEGRTAQKLLAEMRAGEAEGGPAPDLLLFAVVVKACAKGKWWRQALLLLDEMSAAGGECGCVWVVAPVFWLRFFRSGSCERHRYCSTCSKTRSATRWYCLASLRRLGASPRGTGSVFLAYSVAKPWFSC